MLLWKEEALQYSVRSSRDALSSGAAERSHAQKSMYKVLVRRALWYISRQNSQASHPRVGSENCSGIYRNPLRLCTSIFENEHKISLSLNNALCHRLIEQRCQEQPSAPAICAWDGMLTHGTLDAQASRLAAR